MTSFLAKEIANPLKTGERLRERRNQLKLSLNKVSQELNISVKYLEALEQSEFQKIPGEIYAKSFLKAYAGYLEFDVADIVNNYETEQRIYSKTKKFEFNRHMNPVKRVSQLHLLVTPKLLRGMIIGLLICICLIYLGVKVRAIMALPEIKIEQPATDIVTDQNYIEVSGQIGKETTLEINGQPVLIDKQSRFNEVLELQSGTNLIEFKATTRHGKQSKIFRQVIVNK